MTEPKKRKRLSRSATVALKVVKLAPALKGFSEPVQSADSATPIATTATDATPQSNKGPVSDGGRVVLLRTEMRLLREQLAAKTAELRQLTGNKQRGDSTTVTSIIELLSRSAGATKAQIIAESGAKKGYVDALLNRILPARGLAITSIPVDGGRMRSYHISTKGKQDVLG